MIAEAGAKDLELVVTRIYDAPRGFAARSRGEPRKQDQS